MTSTKHTKENPLEKQLFYLIDFANEEMNDGDLESSAKVLRDIQSLYNLVGYHIERETKVNATFLRHMRLSAGLY